jgi:hypothetical protein
MTMGFRGGRGCTDELDAHSSVHVQLCFFRVRVQDSGSPLGTKDFIGALSIKVVVP